MVREDGEIKELGKKLAQNPDSMVFVQLADAYRRAGDLERSVEVCLQGLERHPTYTTARVILGRNYFDMGKLDEATGQFRQIEAVDHENILAHRMLGQIALHKGLFAEAIARQQRVLALDPDDSTAQELLQQALAQAKQNETAAKKGAPAPAPAAPPAMDEQSQALKVADIYIKKNALDKAAEVVQEILVLAPDHEPSQQKLKEILALKAASGDGKRTDDKRKADEEAQRKVEEEKARLKAEEESRRKAEEDKRKADEEVRRKAEEEKARLKAEEESRRKAEDDKRKADEEARRKAEEEKARLKAEEESRRKAEEDKRKAGEEAQRKAEEEKASRRAEEETRRKAEEEEARLKAEEVARLKAEEEKARRKAEEEAQRKAGKETEARGRTADKFTSDDILSVIAGSVEELIENEAAPTEPGKAQDSGPDPRRLIEAFLKAQAIEASLLLDAKGKVLECHMEGDAAVLGQTAAAVFQGAEKAAMNVGFGGLRQVMIAGGDNRQILFLALKTGVLVTVTGKDTNVGLLRVAVQDLMKRA